MLHLVAQSNSMSHGDIEFDGTRCKTCVLGSYAMSCLVGYSR